MCEVIEKEFHYKGYNCVITFNEMGYRSGYISLYENNKFYNTSYKQINDAYKLSRKLNYAGFTFPEKRDCYWIGFTCDSNHDKADLNHVKEVFGERSMVYNFINMQKICPIGKEGTLRTTEYIQKELEKLVDSIEEEL